MSPWAPPKGFAQVPSQIEGIEVFAPEPAFVGGVLRCRACGAPWTAATDRRCAFCGYEEDREVYHEIAQGARLFSVDALAAGVMTGGTERRCGACAAVWEEDPSAAATVCPFCALPAVEAAPAGIAVLPPSGLLPFVKTPEDARVAVLAWLQGGWMHPAALRESVRLERLQGVYWPWWDFSAQMRAHWNAEIGREERKNQWNSAKKTYEMTTVVVWRRESGVVDSAVEHHLAPAADSIRPELLAKVAAVDFRALEPVSGRRIAGWKVLHAGVPLAPAWEAARGALRGGALAGCYANTPTDKVRDLRAQIDFHSEAWRQALLPLYVASYQYGGRAWQVVVNGQTGAVAGARPVLWGRVWGAIAALLAPAVLLTLIGLPLTLIGIGVVFLALALFALVAGGWGAVSLYRRARALEEGL